MGKAEIGLKEVYGDGPGRFVMAIDDLFAREMLCIFQQLLLKSGIGDVHKSFEAPSVAAALGSPNLTVGVDLNGNR